MRKKQVSKELDVFLLLTVCLSLSHLMAIHGTAHGTKGGKIYKHSTFHKNESKAIYLTVLANKYIYAKGINFQMGASYINFDQLKKTFCCT